MYHHMLYSNIPPTVRVTRSGHVRTHQTARPCVQVTRSGYVRTQQITKRVGIITRSERKCLAVKN
jgi:hypothetical protein